MSTEKKNIANGRKIAETLTAIFRNISRLPFPNLNLLRALNGKRSRDPRHLGKTIWNRGMKELRPCLNSIRGHDSRAVFSDSVLAV